MLVSLSNGFRPIGKLLIRNLDWAACNWSKVSDASKGVRHLNYYLT